jgi:integrase
MAKKNIRASLIVYANVNGCWRRGTLIPTKTGFRPDAMKVNGKVLSVSNPVYQIRTYTGSKAKYHSVGANLEDALETLKKVQATRQLEAAQEALGIIVPKEAPKGKKLVELCKEYIAEKKSPSLDLSETSVRHYEDTLPAFATLCKREFALEVTKADIIAYCDHLQRTGYSAKTRKMRYTAVRGFLRSCGVVIEKLIDSATHKRLAPKTEQNIEGYTQKELDKLFAKCDDYHRVVFQFLLATGVRYREANHLTWANVDFDRNVISLPGVQKVNRRFRSRKAGRVINAVVVSKTKSRRGRQIPILASLRPLLIEWRKRNPDKVFVFGTKNDMPDNHWLGYGKLAWRRAGLNCTLCDGCVKREECEAFFLHKFRHSFAHRCLNGGVPIHKVSKMMGHHSIEVTAMYLSGDSTAVEIDPFAVVRKLAVVA